MSALVRPGTKALLRDINNSRVLQTIQARAPISRAKIAKVTQLPPPTVTSIVNNFIRAGLVRETEPARDAGNGPATLGRRPIMLTLNERVAFAIGVKLRPDGLTLAVTDLDGSLVYHENRALQGSQPSDVFEQIAAEVHQALPQAGVDRARVLGFGIGMPGLIDHVAGVCRYSSLLGWKGVDVKGQLEEMLDLSVYVDNDVNMLTAAEVAFGAGREISEFLTVTIGRGIGLGIVMRGEIYRGACGGAGELGHTKIDSQLRCECGDIGCLETVASEPGIRDQVATARGMPSVAIEDALALARAGDATVQAIFDRAGRTLGRSIGNLVNLFNPQRVIVTGEGTRIGPLLFEPMHQAIRETAFGLLGDDTQIVIQRWGDEAWAQGAASIVIHEMLRSPIYESEAIRPLGQILNRGSRRAAGRR